jgi:thiamine-monophosphate kinase
MLDVSDGLLRDAGRVARASGVVLDLDPVPSVLADDLAAVADAAALLGADPQEWVLTGGEDHGLLATFPAGAVLPAPFRRIGRVRAETGDVAAAVAAGVRVLVDGRPPSVTSTGWDHFAR